MDGDARGRGEQATTTKSALERTVGTVAGKADKVAIGDKMAEEADAEKAVAPREKCENCKNEKCSCKPDDADEVLDQEAVVEMTASVEEDSDVVPETEETPVQAAGGTVDRAVSGVAEEVDSADEYSGISSVFRELWTRVTRSATLSSRRERAEKQREEQEQPEGGGGEWR
ncbi:hypothetical protein ABVT39_016589 [Epinephelus coioides]